MPGALQTRDTTSCRQALPALQALEPPQDMDAAAVDAILELVHLRTGIDFSRYRRTTILRRIGNRMISAGATSMQGYLQLLAADAAEAFQLLQRLTIKVSRFYRNARTFDALASDILPAWASPGLCPGGGAPVRLWSAGCGCGEEAYTLAMLLEEAGLPGTVLATDIDPAALAHARQGAYPLQALGELPPHLRDKYLRQVPGGEWFEVLPALRHRVRFGLHDLTSGAAAEAAAFDLVSCRNVLIYFDRRTQQQVFDTLLHATAAGGCLCIGEAEWPMPAVAAALQPVGAKTHLFRRLDPGRPAACSGTTT